MPIFFLISGFYSYKNTKEKIKKKIIHITKLLVITSLLYALWNVILMKFNYISIKGFFVSLIDIKEIIKFVFFNNNPFRTHLWFLSALVCCYIVYYIYNFIKNKMLDRINSILSIILLILYVIISFNYMRFDISKIFIIRNFIFVGFPFFIIGNNINKFNIIEKIRNKSLIFASSISFICLIIETNLYRSELYLSNIFLAIIIFLLCIKNPICSKHKFLAEIGEKYSLYIYAFHPMYKDILNFIYDILYISSEFIIFLKPIFLIIISIVLSILLEKILKHIKVK